MSLEITDESKRLIARHGQLAEEADEAVVASLHTAANAGAANVSSQVVRGELGITSRTPGQGGLAGCIYGWMLDAQAPLAAVGVPSNSPAARYAGILERGGTIVPRHARALSVPVSAEAKMYTSPRDMGDRLTLIPRPGRPALLVEQLASRGTRRANWIIHWVLVGSVRIPAFHWLSRGADSAMPVMADAFESRMQDYVGKW